MKVRTIRFFPLLVLCILLCGCSKSETSVPDSANLVLRSVLEYPNEDLYTPSSAVIGIETKDVDYEEIQKEIDADTKKWKTAVGDCFAGDMFSSFYQQWERSGILGHAYANDLTITVKNIQLVSRENEIGHIQTTIDVTNSEGQTDTYTLEWRIIFDKDTPELIQSVELLDDAGLL